MYVCYFMLYKKHFGVLTIIFFEAINNYHLFK